MQRHCFSRRRLLLLSAPGSDGGGGGYCFFPMTNNDNPFMSPAPILFSPESPISSSNMSQPKQHTGKKTFSDLDCATCPQFL
ncbi:hypothetical protein DAI22_08g148500 [Oryza sativa Japonica Group]|nr:hypothetical protein DAI22_08g148500 [Oryza sativa Japonica Group]